MAITCGHHLLFFLILYGDFHHEVQAPVSAPASAFSHFLYSLDFSMSGLYASAMLISWTKTSSAGGDGFIDTWF